MPNISDETLDAVEAALRKLSTANCLGNGEALGTRGSDGR